MVFRTRARAHTTHIHHGHFPSSYTDNDAKQHSHEIEPLRKYIHCIKLVYTNTLTYYLSDRLWEYARINHYRQRSWIEEFIARKTSETMSDDFVLSESHIFHVSPSEKCRWWKSNICYLSLSYCLCSCQYANRFSLVILLYFTRINPNYSAKIDSLKWYTHWNSSLQNLSVSPDCALSSSCFWTKSPPVLCVSTFILCHHAFRLLCDVSAKSYNIFNDNPFGLRC